MKTLKFVLTSAFVLLFGTVMAQDVTTKYNEAATLIGQQKYAEAIPALEAVMKSAATASDEELELVTATKKLLPDLYYRVGMGSASQRNLDDAVVYLTKSYDLAELYGEEALQLRVVRPLSQVYQMLGGNAFNSKDYAKAIEIFSQAYAKFPTEADLALLLAKSYAESGDIAKASEVYQSIIALEERHSRFAPPAAKAKEELTQYLLVNASEAAVEKDLDKVVEVTDRILAYDPANATAHLLRIQTATNVKDYDKVIAFADSAIEAQTEAETKANLHFFVGSAFENRGNKPRAIEHYRRVTAGPNAAEARRQAAALAQ